MQLQISQKERMFLEDLKHQEDICIQKYQNYNQQAQDPQLKQLLSQIGTDEQHHYDMVSQILQGQQPNLMHGQQSTQNQQMVSQGAQLQSSGLQGAMANQNDATLCSDLLATEKYVSSAYDTAIFEAANPIVRQALQHIQQDEQQHGQKLFDYMNQHGMYQVK